MRVSSQKVISLFDVIAATSLSRRIFCLLTEFEGLRLSTLFVILKLNVRTGKVVTSWCKIVKPISLTYLAKNWRKGTEVKNKSCYYVK